MNRRIAFSTNAFTSGRYTVEDALRIIKDVGYAGAEILADRPHVWVPEVTSEEAASLKALLEELDLQVSNLNANTASGFFGKRTAPPGQTFGPSFTSTRMDYPGCPVHPAAWRVEYTCKCIEFASVIGAPNVSVSSGIPSPHVSRSKLWGQVVDCFSACAEKAAEHGIYLTVEYEPGMLVGAAADCIELVRDVGNEYLGVNFDIGHSYVIPGEDVIEAIKALGQLIRGTHVEDIAGPTPEEHLEPGHLIPGEGAMPLREILSALERIGYQGYYTVELYTYAKPGKDPEYAAAESFRRMLDLLPS